MDKTGKPTRAQLEAARARLLPDVIAPGLAVLFVGINPSLYSTALGYHYARPGNRFWPVLHHCGFTPRLFGASEQALLLGLGAGLTNIAPRTTARADELSAPELHEGARELTAKVERYQPRRVAIVGVTAYRAGFAQPKATLGRQTQGLGGAELWVLPNPSGLNAHYQVRDLSRLYAEALG